MFFVKEHERTITIHPSFFGAHVRSYLNQELIRDVEGTSQGDYFVISVLDNHNISSGRILPGNGHAQYRVVYRAVCWKPFIGEVVGYTM